jgi:hypothetical protein
VASFVGFADGAPLGVRRNLTTMVIMDEPRAKSIYGGTLAAPVFQRVMERSFKFLATRHELGASKERSPFVRPETEVKVKDDELVQASFVR